MMELGLFDAQIIIFFLKNVHSQGMENLTGIKENGSFSIKLATDTLCNSGKLKVPLH